MSKLPKFSLKMYNLQNIAINVIIIKRLLHLRSSHTEVYVRLTITRIKNILKEVLPGNNADKVI